MPMVDQEVIQTEQCVEMPQGHSVYNSSGCQPAEEWLSYLCILS